MISVDELDVTVKQMLESVTDEAARRNILDYVDKLKLSAKEEGNGKTALQKQVLPTELPPTPLFPAQTDGRLHTLPKVKAKKVLITDLDGTLTNAKDGKLPPSVLMKLWNLKDKCNVSIIVCTGRPASWGEMIYSTWPVDGVVCENGGFVCFKNKETAVPVAANISNNTSAETPDHIAFLQERSEQVYAIAKSLGFNIADDIGGRRSDVPIVLPPVNEENPAVMKQLIGKLESANFMWSIGRVPGVGRHMNVRLHKHDSNEITFNKATTAMSLVKWMFRDVESLDITFTGDSMNDTPCFKVFNSKSQKSAFDFSQVADLPGVAGNEKYCKIKSVSARNYGVAGVKEFGASLTEHVNTVMNSDGADGFLEAMDMCYAKSTRAFATLVTNDFYAKGCVALAKSLAHTQDAKHCYPLVCLTGENVSKGAIELMESVGVSVEVVSGFNFSDAFKARHSIKEIQKERPFNVAKKFAGAEKPHQSREIDEKTGKEIIKFQNLDNFMKLRLWEVCAKLGFEKCVYLDADVVVINPIEELFDYECRSCNKTILHAGHNLHSDYHQLNKMNSGVLVFEPSLEVFEEMVDELLVKSDKLGKKYPRTDQTFLEEFFGGDIEQANEKRRIQILDWKYNAQQFFYALAPDAWKWDRIKVVHYIFNKPWDALGYSKLLLGEDEKANDVLKVSDESFEVGLKEKIFGELLKLWNSANDMQISTPAIDMEIDTPAVTPVPPTIASSPKEVELDCQKHREKFTTVKQSDRSLASKKPYTPSKKIFVVGGDGFCGWPLSLYLSKRGHEVFILDNLSRRAIDEELGVQSVTRIATMEERLECWNGIIQNLNANNTNPHAQNPILFPIKFHKVDVAKDYEGLKQLTGDLKPHAIVHLGEQRAAPYSMKNATTRRYTVDNNMNGTNNLMNVILECDKEIHLVHLGTMGVYGYGNVPDTVIPEGYVKIQMQNNKKEWKPCSIMHPYYPGSVYHTTKCLDNTLMSFYGKNYEIQITDLHQGIVWGLDTEETKMDPRLVNRLDCDSDYGTVLNRFVIQAASDKELTVYGTGEQTRAFIHIQNSMECMELGIENPKKPIPGEPLQIFNQMTETYRLLDLVEIIKKSFNDLNKEQYGREVQVKNCANPRKELVRNDLKVSNDAFLGLGLQPISLLGLTELRGIYHHINQVKKDYGFTLGEKELNPCSFWTRA